MSYTAPPRCPDELLASTLPGWAKLVWLAIRSTQGANGEAWAYYETYAERANTSYDMVRKAVSTLKREGWLEETAPASRGNAPRLRCTLQRCEQGSRLTTPKGESTVPTQAEKVGTGFRKGGNRVPKRREQGSHPYKEESVQESVQEPESGARAPEAEKGRGPTLEAVLAKAGASGVKADIARRFFYHYDAEEWTVNGRPLRNWQSKLMQWKITEPGMKRTARGDDRTATLPSLSDHRL